MCIRDRELIELIQKAGRQAVERDTLYNELTVWNEPVSTSKIKSYFSLPVIQN